MATGLPIEVRTVTKRFGEITAVNDLTFTVEPGMVTGFLGPNGAGKTTTLRMLAGLLPPTSGRATVAGLDVTDPAHARRIRSTLGFLPKEPVRGPQMTVPDLSTYFAQLQRILGVEHTAGIEAIRTTLSQWDGQANWTAQYATGVRQRLALARALAHNPSIVFLDEPTVTLAQDGVDTVHELITDLREQGCTVILATRLAAEAERLCDRVAVLNTRVLAVTTPSSGTMSMTI